MTIRHRWLAVLLVCLSLGEAAAAPLEDARIALEAKDYGTALWICVPLAQAGDPEAQMHLGAMYRRGLGVPKDSSLAGEWYRRGANQGHPGAMLGLGLMYRDGEMGDGPYELVHAHMWLNLAAAGFSRLPTGDTVGRQLGEAAGRMRDFVSSRLSRLQLEAAQRMAREWRPSL